MPTATSLPPEQRELVARFVEHLHALGATISDHTRRAYRSRVIGYLHWLDGCDPAQWHGDPLAEPGPARLAVASYRSHLLTVAKRKPETVNAHLTAIDALTQWLGLGAASRNAGGQSTRVDVPASAPRALTPEETKRLLDYVSLRELGEQALVHVLYYTGVRAEELLALDVDDVPMTARTGRVLVRAGKGGKPRSIPIGKDLRPSLEAWRQRRLSECGGQHTGCPLFTTARGGARLGETGLRRRVAALGRAVGIDDLGPHVLRHTFGTRLVRAGVDLATVAELMGHSRTETTRRYAAPTDDDRAAALQALDVDDVPPPAAKPRP